MSAITNQARITAALAVAAALALTPRTGQAHLPWPLTRAVESSDGKYVLVVLMAEWDRAQRRDSTAYDPVHDQPLTEEDLREWDERVAEQRALEAKYPQSGLYRNDGSTELLWPAPYTSACRVIYVANDGVHVVAAQGMWSTCYDKELDSLVFYAAGRRVSGCYETLLLPCYWMRRLLAEWMICRLPYDESMVIDDERSEFSITTNQGDVLRFDLATGDCVRRRSPWPFYFAFPAVAPLVGSWFLLRRWRREDSTESGRGRAFVFSTRELFVVMTLIAGTVAVVQLRGWGGGACAAIAVAGALESRARWASTRAWAVGAVAALYGCYLLLLASALIDTTFFDGWTLLKFWLNDEGNGGVRLTILAATAIAAGWIAARVFSPRMKGAQQKNPATS